MVIVRVLAEALLLRQESADLGPSKDRTAQTFKPGAKPEACVEVFVGNLSWDVTEDSLSQVRSDGHTVSSVLSRMTRHWMAESLNL